MREYLKLYRFSLFFSLVSICFRCEKFTPGSRLVYPNVILSPKSIPMSPMLFRYADDHNLELACADYKYTNRNLDYTVNWVYRGLKDHSKGFISEMQDVLQTAGSMTHLDINNLKGLDISQYIKKCVAYKLFNSRTASLYNAYCSCTLLADRDQVCTYMDGLYKKSYCLDNISESIYNYYYKNKRIEDLCNDIRGKKNFLISEICLGNVAKNLAPTAYKLYPLLDTYKAIPTMVEDAIIREESQLYYLSWSLLDTLKNWSDQHIFCSNYTDIHDVDIYHYKPIRYFYSMSPTLSKVPFGILLKDVNITSPYVSNNYVLLLRDARFTYESIYATSNRLGRIGTTYGDNEGNVHAGYNAVAMSIYPTLESFFTKHVMNESSEASIQFTIIGEGGLGAGAASIISLLLSKQFPESTSKSGKIKYQLITFDAPPIGDVVFTRSLSQKVEIRNIMSRYNGLIHQPCTATAICDKTHFHPSTNRNEIVDGFVHLPGRVIFDMTTLKKYESVWNTATSRLQVTAQSTGCAAHCWLSQMSCKDIPEHYNKCLPSRAACDLFIQ